MLHRHPFTLFACFVVAGVLAGTPARAQYEIALVPQEFDTIQEAIDAVSNGDLVRVAQGTYYEHIDFDGKSITVVSSDPDDPNVVANTIIDGLVSNQKNGDVVKFSSGETNAAVLSGFTLRNGWHGVRVLDASPTVQKCVITGNNATLDPRAPDVEGGGCGLGTGWGAGVAIGYDRECSATAYEYTVRILSCTIEDNLAIGGGGIFYRGQSDGALLQSNTIRGNAVDLVGTRSGPCAGAWLENLTAGYAGLGFECNTLDANDSDGCVDLIPALFAKNATLTGNVIKNHRLWCATHPVSVAGVVADSNTVYDNFALGPELENVPLSIKVGSGTTTLTNNVFHGEAFLDSTGTIDMEVCTVAGQVKVGSQATVAMANSIAWPLGGGAGITVESGGTLAVRYSDVRGGYTGTGNFDADPDFLEPSGDAVYRISCDSPCFDRGEESAVYDGPTHDIDGQTRPRGEFVEVGADEKPFCLDG